MSDDRDARRALLISGALSGDLSAAEQAELDALRRTDPMVDIEIRELSEVLRATTAAAPSWDASAPSEALRDRVLALSSEADIAGSTNAMAPAVADPVTASSNPAVPAADARFAAPRRRPWLVALGAAACVAVGAGGVLLGQPNVPGPPTGPPGTLGAIEQISFSGEPSGVDIDGSLIAHTWGTETILNMTGLTDAVAYNVVLVTVAGESLDSGSFLGSTVAIDCEMNAAVMREAVASVEIQDESGTIVAKAQLPSAD
jgi:hypothetical protein